MDNYWEWVPGLLTRPSSKSANKLSLKEGELRSLKAKLRICSTEDI